MLYELRNDQIVVLVVARGIRREDSRDDVYEQAEHAINSGKSARDALPPKEND